MDAMMDGWMDAEEREVSDREEVYKHERRSTW